MTISAFLLFSWLEPLKELLRLVNEKFKFYFGTMQCAGEVHLQEDEVSGGLKIWEWEWNL